MQHIVLMVAKDWSTRMGLKETFQKQGGLRLVKQYWKGGAFFTAAAEFLLLGKSRTALEILRLSANLKIRQKLEKQYKSKLIQFDRDFGDALPHVQSDKVWICWFQGLENAPELVRKCVQSVRDNMSDKEIVIITENNISEYAQFPDYIWEKWKSGAITHTHMTDLLRLELLIKYGGMWLDATVLCTSQDIPDFYFDSELFFYQSLKPGRDGKSKYISSWLMSAKTNNRVLMATRHLCYEYWKKNDELVDYFLLHDFISIVLDFYSEEWMRVIPRDNATPHVLLHRLFEPYDRRMWEAIKQQTPFHKLTYKFSQKDSEKSGTFYDVLFGDASIGDF